MIGKLFEIDTGHGVAGLLASICILMAFQIIVKVGEFLWKIKKEKDQLSEKTVLKLATVVEENTKAIQHLETGIQHLETAFAEFPKFKLDLRRLYYATKMVAGERWPEIRNEIMKDTEL